MADLTFPSTVPATLTWGFRRNQVIEKALNGKHIRVSRTGDLYEASFSMPPLFGDDATDFRVFLMRLSDVANVALFPDHSYESPTATGFSPLVNGADQTGSTIAVDGLSENDVIKAGTRLQTTDNEILEVTQDGTANVSGEVTLNLARPIRTSPSDNSALEYEDPLGKFLIPDSVVQWAVTAPLNHSFSTKLVEAI